MLLSDVFGTVAMACPAHRVRQVSVHWQERTILATINFADQTSDNTRRRNRRGERLRVIKQATIMLTGMRSESYDAAWRDTFQGACVKRQHRVRRPFTELKDIHSRLRGGRNNNCESASINAIYL